MAGVDDLFKPRAGFFLIAGPCLLEDESTNLRVAEEVARIRQQATPPPQKSEYE